MQYGFYFDSQKCTGCKTCHVACKDIKDAPEGVILRRVYEYAGGQWQRDNNGICHNDVFCYYLSVSCNHCDEPACAKRCPTGACHKRAEDGLVVIDESQCIGCGMCIRACPYDAPQKNPIKHVTQKCDGCVTRLAQGLNPICVDSCPARALDFGPMDQLRKKYGEIIDVAPLPSISKTKPNLIIKANRNSQPGGKILNPSEV